MVRDGGFEPLISTDAALVLQLVRKGEFPITIDPERVDRSDHSRPVG